MECTTASAFSNESLYVSGFKMFALFQLTFFDHSGAVCSEETEDHLGSPERLMEVTSQFRATAALQILLPRNPFPPHTTIFLLADAVAADEAIVTA